MNDTYVTVVGNLVGEPNHTVTAGGTHMVTMRLASTPRRYDASKGGWRDGDTLFVNVSCWRSLAENVAASVRKGEQIVVTGRLRMRTYTTKDGGRRTSVEIDAGAVGHDLSRGVSRFTKTQRYTGHPDGTAAAMRPHVLAADEGTTSADGEALPRPAENGAVEADERIAA